MAEQAEITVYEAGEHPFEVNVMPMTRHRLGLAECCLADDKTIRDWDLLRLLAGAIEDRIAPPTRRDLMTIWGATTPSVVQYRLGWLKNRGWVETPQLGHTKVGPARGIIITSEGRRAMLDYIQWQINHGSIGREA